MEITKIINNLDKDDKKLVNLFVEELLKKEKYKSLREEIEKRREEIRKGEFLTHEEVWDV
jgi:hypothetical protein